MEIFIERSNKTKNMDLKTKISLKELLIKLDLDVNSVILVKNDEICLEDEIVSNEDKIKILSVVSGG